MNPLTFTSFHGMERGSWQLAESEALGEMGQEIKNCNGRRNVCIERAENVK